jgi:hypothetical protein
MTLVCDETLHAEELLTERRRGLRVRQQRPVKIFDPSANRYVGGQTQDVSSSGLQLELPAWAPVVPGKTLEVLVGVGPTGSPLATRRSMVPARVVWVNRTPGKRGQLSVGVQFLASLAAHLDAA